MSIALIIIRYANVLLTYLIRNVGVSKRRCVAGFSVQTFTGREFDGRFRVNTEQFRLEAAADDGQWWTGACPHGALQGNDCRRQTTQQERSDLHSRGRD